MDDATVKQRIQEILRPVYKIDGNYLLMRSDIPLYRAAYADGLEAAASYIASLNQCSKPSAIAAIIRNHAKAMGHE